jgi:hypothetical protein
MSVPTLTDVLSSLAGELCTALSLYATALREPCEHCISDVSECNRRASSLAADTHARLFTLFCPPLPRTSTALLCEKLHTAIAEVFGATMLPLPRSLPGARLSGELHSLCRMGELIRHEVDRLPVLVKGKKAPPPDTYAYYTELTRARAAHALFLSHGARSPEERAVMDALSAVTRSLGEVYAALLFLMMEEL